MLTGSIHAVLLISSPDQVLFWPDDRHDPAALYRAAQDALRNEKAVVKPLRNQSAKSAEPLDVLAIPLFLKNRLLGVVAIAITHRSSARQLAAVQQVQTGAGWLEVMIEMPLDPPPGFKMRNRPSWLKKVRASLQSRYAEIFGPRHLPLKAGVGLTAFLLAVFFMIATLFRVPSDSKSGTVIRYAISAPQQRYRIKTQVPFVESAGTQTLDDPKPSADARKPQGPDAQLAQRQAEATTGSEHTQLAEELGSIEIGPIVREQELKEATSILRGNGFNFQQALGVGTVKVIRLLEGVYTRDIAHRRFEELQHSVDSAFIIPEEGKLAIYVATYRNRAKAMQKLQQLAQKNITVTAVGTEIEMKGTILVVKHLDPTNIEMIADRMSKMGLSVNVNKPG
jgi:hypothetical protein